MDIKVVFSTRAYASVLAETTEKIKTETGGLFLGAYENGIWYVVEAIDPGPKSIFEVAYFEYDQAYTQHLIRKVANLYAAELRLIGLWHRHPGSFDVFSSTDDGTNSKYARLNEQGAVSALVNIDPKFRITMYHVARPCKYSKIDYEVGDGLIPPELMAFKTPGRFEQIMGKIMLHNKSDSQTDGYHKSVSFTGFLKTIAPYLSDSICEEIVPEPSMEEEDVREKIIDALIDDVSFLADNVGVELTVLQRGKNIVLVQEAIEGITRLYFAYSEAGGKAVFEYKGKSYYYENGMFRKLFIRAAADKGKENVPDVENASAKLGSNEGALGTVLRIIRNKSGEKNNGQH